MAETLQSSLKAMVLSGTVGLVCGLISSLAGWNEIGRHDSDLSWLLYVATLLAAAITITAWTWSQDPETGHVSAEVELLIASAFQGAVLIVATLALFVVGIFAPFLFELGGREVSQFGEGGAYKWQQWLLVLFIFYAVLPGAVIGGLVGLLAWFSRFLIRSRT